jgi:deoxyribodipyrimidine photo-lyase
MNANFATDYETILQQVDRVDPIRYGKTRNYINGAVSYLSPYLSRGVISTQQVLEHLLSKGFQLQRIEPFVKELCWRDYFQRVGQHKDLNQDIRKRQEPVSNDGIPGMVVKAKAPASMASMMQ